jgi:hypothetical protein
MRAIAERWGEETLCLLSSIEDKLSIYILWSFSYCRR